MGKYNSKVFLWLSKLSLVGQEFFFFAKRTTRRILKNIRRKFFFPKKALLKKILCQKYYIEKKSFQRSFTEDVRLKGFLWRKTLWKILQTVAEGLSNISLSLEAVWSNSAFIRVHYLSVHLQIFSESSVRFCRAFLTFKLV